jgi:hypothetical protein
MPKVRRRQQIKIGMSVDEAEESSGVSRSLLYVAMEIAENPQRFGPENPPTLPPLPSVKIRTTPSSRTSRRIILVEDLRHWLMLQRVPPASTIAPLLLVTVAIHHFVFLIPSS